MIQFHQIKALPTDFNSLLELSQQEGFNFLVRLHTDWAANTNRFDKMGEALYIGRHTGGKLICIGGINQDPYTTVGSTGRLRRFYVHPLVRRTGIGRKLLSHILENAQPHFKIVQLRTLNPAAASFYQSCGFEAILSTSATHQLSFPT